MVRLVINSYHAISLLDRWEGCQARDSIYKFQQSRMAGNEKRIEGDETMKSFRIIIEMDWGLINFLPKFEWRRGSMWMIEFGFLGFYLYIDGHK
jgi:hypothetical protein